MEFLNKIIERLPSWIFAFALFLLAVAMINSYVTKEPFKVADSEFGWKAENGEKDITETKVITDIVEWQKKKFVVDAAQKIWIDNHAYLEEIYSCYPEFNGKTLDNSQKYISKDDAREIIQDKSHAKLYASLKAWLNYLEGLSVAYKSGVAEQELFEVSFKGVIGTWYGRLQGFIEVAHEHCSCDWAPFEQLGAKWNDARIIAQDRNLRIESCIQKNPG